ncbi:hypothetical protein BDV96DRAFT_644563 [Lophiotrema nucula]|uniref:NAD(P)-binding domain-containing protein n=1 Tax=Lophiotrema nucula TaxID=690887 RepID=A0A6A5ZCC2_9PLEO|nr:hypothetical protein BDV96DRAFT_644563 [Lophiotrema nucula]
MSSNHITKVAIVGATGRIGRAFAVALLETGKHEVTAIVRPDTNKDKLPKGIKTAAVDYDSDESIVSALKGQEFLCVTLSVFAPKELHGRIVKAAGEAGVKWIMPNIYGGDITNASLSKESLYGDTAVANLEDCKAAGIPYIVLCCGFWYEWSLALGEQWFGFTIKDRKATLIIDDGEEKISVSTWEQCGRALAALLSLPVQGEAGKPGVEDWKNKLLYINSFTVSQRDMLNSLHRVLGTSDSDWTITREPAKQRYQDGIAEMQRGERTGFAKAMYTRFFFKDGGGNHEETQGLVNEKLGLPKEDLDFSTKRAVQMVESGWNPFAPGLDNFEMPKQDL